jgi:hypothetical protein
MTEEQREHPLAPVVRRVRQVLNHGDPGDLEYADVDRLTREAERTVREESTTPAPFARELATGLVEPGTDDARCIRCGAQAILYALDVEQWQWFTCLDHHGVVIAELLRGKHDGTRPPLPPL